MISSGCTSPSCSSSCYKFLGDEAEEHGGGEGGEEGAEHHQGVVRNSASRGISHFVMTASVGTAKVVMVEKTMPRLSASLTAAASTGTARPKVILLTWGVLMLLSGGRERGTHEAGTAPPVP